MRRDHPPSADTLQIEPAATDGDCMYNGRSFGGTIPSASWPAATPWSDSASPRPAPSTTRERQLSEAPPPGL
jgi:hypothetical protein